tara:strand:+ start:1135 stop:2751 length:1617 start_codon:yes stop_codon:yes gene_type:complete
VATKPANNARRRYLASCALNTREWAKNPASYIFEAVSTKDEHDFQTPVKKFPERDYLEQLLAIWHGGESVEALIKSRQLMVSWLAVAYCSWFARFHEHKLVFIQSKKEKDAAALIFDTDTTQGRLSFIETHLPEYLRQDIKWAYGKAIYPNGSRVEAIPQGPTHYESYVPSLVFNDEASLQDEWQSGHAALRPCIDGGGRCITVATVRMPSDYSEEMRGVMGRTTHLMRGMERFRSESGIAATSLHYSADPDKDPATENGKAWYSQAVAGYPGGAEGHLWRQHMELDFEAASGTRLIPFFDAKYEHLTCAPIPQSRQVAWRYYAGFDYGKRNLTVFGVYAASPDGMHYMVWELAKPGEEIGGVPGIAKQMRACPYWDAVKHNIKADPTIWNDNQAKTGGGYTSIAQLLSLEGVRLGRAPLNGQLADEIVIDRLLFHYWAEPERPKLKIFRSCTEHIRQFKKLRYKEWSGAQGETRSLQEELVDKDNDSFDCYKYAECARPSPAIVNVRAPKGSFEYVRKKMISTMRPKAAKARLHRHA